MSRIMNPLLKASKPTPHVLEALTCLPLFGGAETATETQTSESSSASSDNSSTDTGSSTASFVGTGSSSSAGGDSGTELTPEQIQELVKRTEELTNTNKELLKKTSKYENDAAEAEKAKLSREEALESDLQKATDTIVQLDTALKRQAVVNAINSFDELKFHDVDFIVHELDPAIMEDMIVDLENSTVTVKGIENDLRRIAKEKSWAVKQTAAGDQQKQQRQQRPSGAPPSGNNGGKSNSGRREELLARFPVIGHGIRR